MRNLERVGSGIGTREGTGERARIEDVNLLTAATSWRSPFQRLGFWLLNRTDWQARALGGRKSLLLNLKDLNHLHYGSWVDIGTFPPVLTRPGQTYPPESGRRYWNVFNGNFNQGWEPYMESFLDNTAGGVHLAWGDTVGYPGYPRHGSLKETLRWQTERRIPNLHYYVAYPGATTNDVRAVVRLRRELLSFTANQATLGPTDTQRAVEFDRFTARVQHCLTGLPERPMRRPVELGPENAVGVDGFTALFPVVPTRVPQAEERASSLGEGEQSPFRELPGTHFGRLAILPSGTTPGRGDAVALRNTWLLISVVLDVSDAGTPGRPRIADADLKRCAGYIRKLDCLKAVLQCCYGFDDNEERFAEWFLSGVCPRYLTHRDYPDVTLREIEDGFRLAAAFARVLQNGNGNDLDRLLAECRRSLSAGEELEPGQRRKEEVLATSGRDVRPV